MNQRVEPGARLVQVEELAAAIGRGDGVVVDCRFDLARPDAGEAAWRAGHIAGAHYAHLDRDLAAARTAASGRHPLPDPQQLVRLFSSWGIGPGVPVVAYDAAGGAWAARLWWLLRWMGHAEVALLDGGLPAWVAAGHSLSTAAPAPRPAVFRGTPGQMPVIEAPEIERRLDDPGLRLLDARLPARYRGDEEPIDPVAGHVPGAINQPFQLNLTPDGRFRTPDELRELFAPHVAGAPHEIAVMCGSGVTACHDLFALERAGLGTARLYPGSWSEWIRTPSRPVARGPQP